MSKKANPTVVGGFVIGALVIAISGALLLGGRNLFEKKIPCILYFDESISGLDVGAPVDFRGVRIGTVTGVRLELDDREGVAILRPVTLQIEESRITFLRERDVARGPREVIEHLVEERGLRARLATQSLLTGKHKIELGYFPDTKIVRRNRDPGLWELPTVPSPFKKAETELAQLPIQEIVTETHRAIKHMADILDPETTGKTFQNVNATLARLETVLARMDAKIDPMTQQTSEVLAEAKGTLSDLRATLDLLGRNVEPLLKAATETSGHVNALLDPQSELHGEVSSLIDDLQQTSKSLRRLTDYVEEHPESLLRGKK